MIEEEMKIVSPDAPETVKEGQAGATAPEDVHSSEAPSSEAPSSEAPSSEAPSLPSPEAARAIRVNFAMIPQELKANASFCVWLKEKRDGKPTKVPYDPKTGQLAKTNDPSTFADFATAMKVYAMGGWDGIGYRVAEGSAGAIDIDHCIREDGTLNDVASAVLSLLPTAYFERSPSGSGLRGFFRLDTDFIYDKTKFYINNRKHGLEVYLPNVTNRFVTVTGDVYRQGAVAGSTPEALQAVLDRFMRRKSPLVNTSIGTPVSFFSDEQVIAHAGNTANEESNEKFKDLFAGRWEERYDSQSDADMALASILCFWCGGVEEQIDRLFRSSGLMRDKWDRATGDSTYGAITIRNAVLSCKEVYKPVTSAVEDFTGLNAEQIQAERDRREQEGYTFAPDYDRIETTIEALRPHSNPRYDSLQIGNSKMYTDYYFPIILMNETRGCWYIYDGRVWRPDIHGLKSAEMAKRLREQLLEFAGTITSEDTRERFLKRVSSLDQKKIRDIMVKDAAATSEITVRMAAFDRDKYVFNCHNGTINLLTGEFKAHSPSDHLTKITEVDYDPDAVCERWSSFLDEIFEGDKERIRYMQKVIGYAMSGDTRLECMFLLYGPSSRNGKGTLMETVLRIMGEYGRTAKPDMLSKKGYADSAGPSEDVARLNGARLVNISEPEKSMVIDASLTKQMTGNNTVTARFLRENSFEFKPQFKLIIDTNHLPQISDMTLFESDRIRIIPFNRHFKEGERDIDLKSFFAQPENLSGILNWCLEGFQLYHAEGLKMPQSVIEATSDYRTQSDRIMMFTAQWIKREAGKELRSSAIYTKYRDWCKENGFRYENAANLRKKMETAGFVYMRRRPWSEKETNPLIMVNDVTWREEGEEQKTI